MKPTIGKLTAMKKQQKLIRNTPSEEADIARGIAADPDTFVPSDEQLLLAPESRKRKKEPTMPSA
jgi:hypothetical protein